MGNKEVREGGFQVWLSTVIVDSVGKDRRRDKREGP